MMMRTRINDARGEFARKARSLFVIHGRTESIELYAWVDTYNDRIGDKWRSIGMSEDAERRLGELADCLMCSSLDPI